MPNTIQPRKNRKTLYNLDPRSRRKQLSAHLAEDLLVKYNTRAVTLRKGDTVVVMRGDYKGTVGKVLDVDARNTRVTVEGVTTETAKHQSKPRWMHPSNLVVKKLDLTDPLRRKKLGASEADVSDEDRAKPKMEKKSKKSESAEEAEDADQAEEEAPKKGRSKKAAKAADEEE